MIKQRNYAHIQRHLEQSTWQTFVLCFKCICIAEKYNVIEWNFDIRQTYNKVSDYGGFLKLFNITALQEI